MPGVDELLAHMADCMARCKAHGISLAALDPQRVERVEELYRQLVMSVLASKQECAEQMAQMGRGRAMLRAYSFSPESGKR